MHYMHAHSHIDEHVHTHIQLTHTVDTRVYVSIPDVGLGVGQAAEVVFTTFFLVELFINMFSFWYKNSGQTILEPLCHRRAFCSPEFLSDADKRDIIQGANRRYFGERW